LSALEVIIRLAAVAVLSSYLYLKHRQRVRRQWVNGYPKGYNPAEWTGKGIDVTPIKPGLEDVRRDYLAARYTASGTFFHRSLLGLARRTVAGLAFFHDREPAEPGLSSTRAWEKR
jgi:hypothetical protein